MCAVKDIDRECAKNGIQELITCQAMTRSIERLGARLTKIKKQHTSLEKESVVSDFLQQEFILPRLGYCNGKVVNFSPMRQSKQSKTAAASQDSDRYVELFKEAKQKMYSLNRNANKRLKRREAVIQKQDERIQSQQEAIIEYERKLVGTESQLKKLKAKLDRVNHRAAYWKAKVGDSKSHCSIKKKKLQDEISLKEEVSTLNVENMELNETIQ